MKSGSCMSVFTRRGGGGIVTGLAWNLYGPSGSNVTANGPSALGGSRHESEHEPPQPYLMRKVLLYVPSALRIRICGPLGGREPLRVYSM